jgi:membrane protease YdiL (CAAX protease family)
LSLAARVFGAESVLYSEQSSWADLLRRPEAPQPAASLPAMLWCLALMLPIQFALLALLRVLGPFPPALGVGLGVGVNVLLFGGLPALFVYLGRVELASGLGLSAPRPAALSAGVLLGVSLWPLELELLHRSGVTTLVEERFSAVLENLQGARASIGWFVLVAVVVPAVLEEIFFRGLLFNALKRHGGAWLTVGVTGLLFGLSHVVLGGALGLERLVPSLLLGLVLSAVCWQSGSLWPSLTQHVLHNAVLLGVGLYAPGSTREIPWYWLAGGSVGTLFGALLLWQGRKHESPETSVPGLS